MKSESPNKRGAGKGGTGVLWRAGRAWPALPDRERYASRVRTMKICSSFCPRQLLSYALAGFVAACCSCSKHPSFSEDPLVPLGTMSATMDMASEHAELLMVLKTNGLLIAGSGSRIWQFDVPLSKFDLAVSILRTNRLVRDNIFELNTNKNFRTFNSHP